jgi:hypothetical protein
VAYELRPVSITERAMSHRLREKLAVVDEFDEVCKTTIAVAVPLQGPGGIVVAPRHAYF